MKNFKIRVGRWLFRKGFDLFTQEYRKYMQSLLSSEHELYGFSF